VGFIAMLAVGPCEREANAQLLTPGAGVVIDANGLLRTQVFQDPTGQVMRERIAQAKAAQGEVGNPSPLRKISLNRLEKAIDDLATGGRKPTDDMKYLAGLTRIKYVFFYPDTGDVVVAGPAEG